MDDPNKLLTPVSGKYGAPMGRNRISDNPESTVTLFRVLMVDGDYDRGGAYWGGGEGIQPLYAAIGDGFQWFARANTLHDARSLLSAEFPKLTIEDGDTFPEFLDGYITCALWAENDNSDESGGEPFDRNYGPEDIAPEALERMTADCRKFYDKFGELIESIPGKKRCGTDSYGRESYSWSECAGHDFWLTRNGHGTGFWDAGRWPDDIGETLDEACGWRTEFPECYLYLVDDGKIYCD